MKDTAIVLALSLVFISSVQANNHSPELQIINTDNQRWHFRQVIVNHTDAGLTVFGRMNASYLRYDLPRGHVDVSAWSADDELIVETTTDYTPRFLTRRASRKGGVRFSATLPSLPEDAVIRIAFHRDKSKQAQKPVQDHTAAH